MRTLRLSLAGTVILALLGVLTMAAVAQDEDAPPTATYVTGEIMQVMGSGDVEHWEEGGVEHTRGMLNEQVIEWSDPRLPSRLLLNVNHDSHTPDANTSASSYRLEPLRKVHGEGQEHLLALEAGPEGAWVGTGRGYFGFVLPEGCDYAPECQLGPGDGPKIAGLVTLAGEGVYEGLSAMISSTFEEGTPAFEGYIFEGALPPMPDPVEPPAE